MATITVFAPNYGDNFRHDFVAKLTNAGLNPLVDTYHFPTENHRAWFDSNNFTAEYNAAVFEVVGDIGDVHVMKSEDDIDIAIRFYGEDIHPDWNRVLCELENVLNGKEYDRDVLYTNVVLPNKLVDDLVIVNQNVGYEMSSMYLEDMDTKVFQINAYSDVPYTVVINDYSHRGNYPLFTSLFVCDNWNNSYNLRHTHAYTFLKKLWDVLEMEGDFDLDKMLAEEVQKYAVTPQNCQPPCEPIVYRRPLKEVVATLRKKRRLIVAEDDVYGVASKR